MEYIQPTKEFIRIKNLPRRKFNPDDSSLLVSRDMINAWLKTPNGEQQLSPIQAFILKELYNYKGFIGAIPVGQGKTHPACLAATVLDAKRPVMILPSKHVKEKTPRDMSKLRDHWRIRSELILPTKRVHKKTVLDIEKIHAHQKKKGIILVGYEKIGVVSGKDILTELNPDLLILDEMQFIRNRKAGRSKRIQRFVRDKRPIILGLSGTFITDSILNGWHIMYWTFPYTLPLPRNTWEVSNWAKAIEGNPQETGIAPGCLYEFCDLNESISDGVGRRIVETPGIVSVDSEDVRASLSIEGLFVKVPENINQMIEHMRSSGETPSGDIWKYYLELWRHAKTLGCGYYREWKTPPPEEWLEKRSTYAKMVRDTLKYSRTLDTPLQVALEAKNGKLSKEKCVIYEEWKDIEPIFKPITVPVWVSDYLIEYCAAWLMESDKRLLWCDLKPFSERLSKRTGIPYFCSKGKTVDGLYIEDYNKAAIVSPNAIGDGYNLQYAWDTNLIVSCVSSSDKIEQLIGRTHRQFQKSDEVKVQFLFTVKETVKAFYKTIEEAKKYKTVLKSKLLYADYINLDIDAPINMEEI